MSKWRNVTDEELWVGFGIALPTLIAPDAVLSVDDEADESYACQPETWQPSADAPKSKSTPTPSTAPDAPAA